MRRLGRRCHALVFDWDQTLCTTKSGNAPVVGRHKLQPDLATLLPAVDGKAEGSVVEGSPRCCVATRNANGDAIEAFLLAAGVAMPVNCVNAQQRTKADVALEQLAMAPRDGVVVLVDDDLRELVMDERLAAPTDGGARVHRVFFSPRELS